MPLLLLHCASGYSWDDVPTDPHPLYPQAYQHHATLPVIRSYVSNTVVRRCNRICNAVEHGAFRAGVEYEGWIVGRRGKQQRRGVTTDSMAICVHTARPAVGRMPCPASAATACFFLLSFPSLFPKLELVLSLLSSLFSGALFRRCRIGRQPAREQLYADAYSSTMVGDVIRRSRP